MQVLVKTKQTENISWVYVNSLNEIDRKYYTIIAVKGNGYASK